MGACGSWTRGCNALHPKCYSFAGKTTLLDLVAGRKTMGRLGPESRILYNGRPPTAAYLRTNGA